MALGGTLTVQVNQGVATFSDLALDLAADGYTLQVSSSGLPSITTAAFERGPGGGQPARGHGAAARRA